MKGFTGKLDRRLRIDRYSVTRDALNNPVEGWAPFITVATSKLDVSDRERFAAKQLGADITTRFEIRYSVSAATVNAKDRIVFEGRTFDIFGVKEIGRREGFEISATARAD